MRWKRNTGVPGLERSVSDSSGVTVPLARLSHTLRGLRPRARMSSENEVSFEKFFSTRSLHERAGALAADQQAFLDEPVDGLAHGDARDAEFARRGRARAAGRRRRRGCRFSMASRSARCSCWYSGRLLEPRRAAPMLRTSVVKPALPGAGSVAASRYQCHIPMQYQCIQCLYVAHKQLLYAGANAIAIGLVLDRLGISSTGGTILALILVLHRLYDEGRDRDQYATDLQLLRGSAARRAKADLIA